MNLIRTSLLMLLALALSACEEDKYPIGKPTPNGGHYSERLLAEMPNGCSMFAYKATPPGDKYPDNGRYVLCSNGAQTADTHNCGKNCTSHTAVIGDPVAIKRAAAYSKLSEEERQLLGVK